MHPRSLVVAALGAAAIAGACSGAPGRPEAVGARPVSSSAPPAAARPSDARAACPSAAEIEVALRAQWGFTGEPDREVQLDACVPGDFGAPGWAIAARHQTEVDEGLLHHQLWTLDGQVLAAAAPESIRLDHLRPVSLEVHDFDRDGVDEVVERSVYVESGVTDDALRVWRRARATLIGSRELSIATYPQRGTGCAADVAFEAGGLVLTTDGPDGPDPDGQCLTAGRHHFRWQGGELIRWR